MLSSDEGGNNDEFFDSVDSLSAQDSVLARGDFGSGLCGGCCDYEIWVNEPVSVKERRDRFMKGMGLADTYSCKVCSQEEMKNFDASSISLGMDRVRECSGAVLNACISPAVQASVKVVRPELKVASEVKVLFDELKESSQGQVHEVSCTAQEQRAREPEAQEEFQDFDMGGRKDRKIWWKRLANIRKGGEGKIRSKLNTGTHKTPKVKVRQKKKRWLEFSGLYIGQQIRAHKGLIWTMKFSPNGKYLASGGEDGLVFIWCVVSLDTSSSCFSEEDSIAGKVKRVGSSPWKKHSIQSFIFLPNKIFQIHKSPLQECYGHSSDVLDLAWSNSDSDLLLSSSMDETVRLWKVGSGQCLSVFRHTDYVTCIQFNPVDENYFISGSIDGKVRIWGIREERVIDWADIHDVISAICYRQDGKGFAVGTITGTCCFYVASGKYFQLEAQMHVHGKKKVAGNKITSIQFCNENHQRIMITSEDSKIRVFDGTDLFQKYAGLPKSGSQMSGSFTPSGKHIISVGEDSNVYIWNFNDLRSTSSKNTKSEHSCEYFFSKGVTVAIPWPGMKAEPRGSNSSLANSSSEIAPPEVRDSGHFSLGNWFSTDGPCRGSTTWPEEKLPVWDLPLAEQERDVDHKQQQQLCHRDGVSETWGLSVVVAGCDGTIKTFHNFGLPIRL